jgi:hypothetical protein
MTKTYEYWEDDEGHAFFPSDCTQREIILGANPRLVWTIEADSWEDAMEKRAEYLGETYKPLEEE